MESGVIGISWTVVPSGSSASLTALNIVPGAAAVPDSPTPFAPSPETEVGVSTWASTMSGISPAHGHQIVDHRAIQELAVRVVEAVFVQHVAQPLDDRAAQLLFREERVDQTSTVLDRPVTEDADLAGTAVDFDLRAVRAVGEDVFRHAEPAGLGKRRVDPVGQLARAEKGDVAELGEAHPRPAAGAIHDGAVSHRQCSRVGLKQRPGEVEDFIAQCLAGPFRGFAPPMPPPREPYVPPP